MKILLLCNIIPRQVSELLKIKPDTGGGWVHSLIDVLEEYQEIQITVCFPYKQNKYFFLEDKKNSYYGFHRKIMDPAHYDNSVEAYFKQILLQEQPDLIHVFGTEYPHTLAMIRAFHTPERTLVHLQGLCSYCCPAYTYGLPYNVVNHFTFRDFIRKDNIKQQQKKFQKRGMFEQEALRQSGHVAGRTHWDKACSGQINPKLSYHYVQEALRTVFYTGQWDVKSCQRYSIFMSQGAYPIKGLHYALETLAVLRKKYPNVKLYIAGPDICDFSTLIKKLKKSSYSQYIRFLITQYGLQENVKFLGMLSDAQMKQQYLACSVFLSASTIENSPNSIGEAMMLGVPVVASDVGGVSSLIRHEDEGFLYPLNEPYMAAYYIEKLFVDSDLAKKIGKKERIRALELYDKNKIVKDTI